jgi:prepilin-type N-terminal cleavage/methylation domain-containing protein
MTSTARRCDRGRGFTLLEVVIALTIIAMIMGGAVGLVTISSDEYALKKATRELEALAKRARMTAVLKQTPYALVFHDSRVEMMSWARALEGQGLVDQIALQSEGEAGQQEQRWELSFDNGMTASVRRWNSEEWLPAQGNAVHAWRFDPSGLCEPLGVMLVLEDSSAQMVFHPLTGAIKDIAFNIQ